MAEKRGSGDAIASAAQQQARWLAINAPVLVDMSGMLNVVKSTQQRSRQRHVREMRVTS